jgi:hypothetical protein
VVIDVAAEGDELVEAEDEADAEAVRLGDAVVCAEEGDCV